MLFFNTLASAHARKKIEKLVHRNNKLCERNQEDYSHPYFGAITNYLAVNFTILLTEITSCHWL